MTLSPGLTLPSIVDVIAVALNLFLVDLGSTRVVETSLMSIQVL